MFVAAACALGAVGVARLRRSRAQGVALLAAAVVTAAVPAAPLAWDLGVRAVYRAGLLFGRRDLLVEFSWELNTKAEPTRAWYGPLATLLLVAGAVVVLLAWRRRTLPAVALALAAAPWMLVSTLALTLNWDPWRGRFLIFGVALAAATWGILLRYRPVALAGAAIGSTALFLALANYEGKPSGLFSEATIWGNPRWEAQTRLSGPRHVFRFFDENVPADARIGVSLTDNHHLHPYFGANLSRHVSLVPAEGGSPPAAAEWLVLAPETNVRRCTDAWRAEHVEGGWSVERRVAPDDCF